MKHHNIVVLRKIILQIELSYISFEPFLKRVDHTDKQRLVRLWLHIDGCQGRYSDDQDDREQAWSSMFGKEVAYHKRRMQQLMSFLREQAVLYIYQYQIENTSEGRYSMFNLLERMGLNGSAYAPNDDGLIEWKYLRDLHFSGKGGKATDSGGALQRGLKMFTSIYNQDVLLAYVDICSQYRIERKEIPEKVIHTAQEVMANTEQTPINNVGCAALRYFINPHTSRYHTLDKLYFKNFGFLGTYQSFLLIILVNAVAVIPHRDEFFSHEYVRLYRFGFEHDLLRQHGKISAFRFNNIVFSAEFVSDYAFIDQVITSLGPCIADPKQKDISMALANAYACFGKGKYDEAIEHLSYLKHAKDVPFHFIMKKQVLVIKCLYEGASSLKEAALLIQEKYDGYFSMLKRYTPKYIDEMTSLRYENYYRVTRALAQQKEAVELFEASGEYIIQRQWLKEKFIETRS